MVSSLTLLVAGLVISPALLAVPRSDEPLAEFTMQLSLIVAPGLVVTTRLLPLAKDDWFAGFGSSPLRRRLMGRWCSSSSQPVW